MCKNTWLIYSQWIEINVRQTLFEILSERTIIILCTFMRFHEAKFHEYLVKTKVEKISFTEDANPLL